MYTSTGVTLLCPPNTITDDIGLKPNSTSSKKLNSMSGHVQLRHYKASRFLLATFNSTHIQRLIHYNNNTSINEYWLAGALNAQCGTNTEGSSEIVD